MNLEKLLLGAFGTDDVLRVGDETSSDQRRLAHGADEAVVVPVAVFERDETSSADTGDWLRAGCTPLGEEFTETFGTIGLIVARSKSLSGQRSRTVSAGEALTMPWLVLVSHTTLGDDLVALDAASGKLLLVAAGAIDFLFAWDETLGSDRSLADAAAEALLVPLTGLVLHLLGTSTEDFTASIATGCELGIVAVSTIDLVYLRSELLVDKGNATLGAQEASLMPVLVLV